MSLVSSSLKVRKSSLFLLNLAPSAYGGTLSARSQGPGCGALHEALEAQGTWKRHEMPGPTCQNCLLFKRSSKQSLFQELDEAFV